MYNHAETLATTLTQSPPPITITVSNIVNSPLTTCSSLCRYDPLTYYEGNAELKKVIDMIKEGFFSKDEPDHFHPLMDTLLVHGDRFCLLADYEA
jgi:hypothetical protein